MREQERHIRVRRTARFCIRGEPGTAVRELWVVCHGYAQLARSFIRSFDPIDDGTRLIVAPEALNRFYHARGPSDSAHSARVAATWMTREDRDHEIDDYVAYLDDLSAHMSGGMDEPLRRIALGFSQGAATASRWAASGTTSIDDLVLWGSGPAHDLHLTPDALRGARLHIVAGRSDPHLDPARLAGECGRLAAAGVDHELLVYDGAHAIDPTALRDLATRIGS
jgi:predicted esterase